MGDVSIITYRLYDLINGCHMIGIIYSHFTWQRIINGRGRVVQHWLPKSRSHPNDHVLITESLASISIKGKSNNNNNEGKKRNNTSRLKKM